MLEVATAVPLLYEPSDSCEPVGLCGYDLNVAISYRVISKDPGVISSCQIVCWWDARVVD